MDYDREQELQGQAAAGDVQVSAYTGDPRVRFHSDGTVTLPDGEVGDWLVSQVVDVWMAAHPTQGMLRDRVDGRYSAAYVTRDEVLEHLLGPAQVAA
jgi:hypothetical protein